jgi:hypothetical protein
MAADQLQYMDDLTKGPPGTWGLTFADSDRLDLREQKFVQQQVRCCHSIPCHAMPRRTHTPTHHDSCVFRPEKLHAFWIGI